MSVVLETESNKIGSQESITDTNCTTFSNESCAVTAKADVIKTAINMSKA